MAARAPALGDSMPPGKSSVNQNHRGLAGVRSCRVTMGTWECPMLGSIYGGWLDWNGSLDYQGENMITFTARLARDVYWGGAMGAWCNPDNWW